jgi:hypothetical protein
MYHFIKRTAHEGGLRQYPVGDGRSRSRDATVFALGATVIRGELLAFLLIVHGHAKTEFECSCFERKQVDALLYTD